MDGISWRPLLEDIETAYLQLKAGEGLALPAKTTSYKRWAEQLREFAGAGSLQRELPFWKNVTHAHRAEEALRFMAASEDSVTNISEGSACVLKSSLTVAETQALLQQVPAAYNTQINDVLLTALARAWSISTGSLASPTLKAMDGKIFLTM